MQLSARRISALYGSYSRLGICNENWLIRDVKDNSPLSRNAIEDAVRAPVVPVLAQLWPRDEKRADGGIRNRGTHAYIHELLGVRANRWIKDRILSCCIDLVEGHTAVHVPHTYMTVVAIDPTSNACLTSYPTAQVRNTRS